MTLSMMPLLLAEKDIPNAVKKALREDRLHDAADLLIQEFGLSCIEASNLLGVSAC